MKSTNCYRYMAVLYTASCGAASPLYGPLETGLQESQLLNSLKTCKSLEGPETDAYLSRTGLNGAYKTKKPIGGLFFSLHFEYGKDGGLKAVSFYSTTKAGKEEYDTRLKSLYKRMLNGLPGCLPQGFSGAFLPHQCQCHHAEQNKDTGSRHFHPTQSGRWHGYNIIRFSASVLYRSAIFHRRILRMSGGTEGISALLSLSTFLLPFLHHFVFFLIHLLRCRLFAPVLQHICQHTVILLIELRIPRHITADLLFADLEAFHHLAIQYLVA